MWAIKFLNGPQAGKIYNLKAGKNVLGRSKECDIQVLSLGASKEHCEVIVFPDKVMIVDLKSRNGTLLNGIKIQNGLLKLGTKAAIHDIIFELVPAESQGQAHRSQSQFSSGAAAQYHIPIPQHSNAEAFSQATPSAAQPQMNASQNYMTSQGFVKGLISNIEDYLNRVALPGVYRLPEYAEFKWVIGGFLGALIIVVTMLCMLPAIQIGKASIINESKRRVVSLARSLAMLNQTALLQGASSSVQLYSIENEEGVKQAFIIQQVDGLIIAPASQQGKVPDIPFVHSARRENKQQVEVLDGNTIGASYPIGVFDPVSGENNVKYHAIVFYDVGSIAFDDNRAVSLFMQTLILAIIVGFGMFYFMYKLIEYPLIDLNSQLDLALRENKDNLSSQFQYPALQNLISNLNSLLTRQGNGDHGGPSLTASYADEAAKVVTIIKDPTLVIREGGQIAAANSHFEKLLHAGAGQLINQNISQLSDQSLLQNLEFLMNRSREAPFVSHSDQLEFGGQAYLINCQAFGQPLDYYIVTLLHAVGGSE